MEFKRFGSKYVVRMDKGEEIVSTLTDLVKKENIRLGRVSGIGAVNRAVIGLFELDKKEYHKKEFKGDFEVLSLSGNISEMDEKEYLHFHITFGDKDFNVYGGHLNEAVISATGEIIIDVIDGRLDRQFDEDLGLNILKF